MCIRPLAGCRLFLQDAIKAEADYRIRPLAGCKLFPLEVIQTGLKDGVFVPLRGVDCFIFDPYVYNKEGKYSSPCGV